ncbi:MAG: CDP-alcohol phosphatidyltransferase family protein [Chloroflexota bacterium]
MTAHQPEGILKGRPPNILLYPCNLVGYGRLILLAGMAGIVYGYHWLGLTLGSNHRWGIAGGLFVTVLLLDIADGYLARKLGHATKFGAILDFTIDLLNHTFVWVLSGLSLAPLIIAIEWTAGLLVATFIREPTHHWKATLLQAGPGLVRVYFQPMRLNLLNVYSNLAHFAFPISLFVAGQITWLSYLMLPGLLVFELVTLYMIYTFLKILIAEDDLDTIQQTDN